MSCGLVVVRCYFFDIRTHCRAVRVQDAVDVPPATVASTQRDANVAGMAGLSPVAAVSRRQCASLLPHCGCLRDERHSKNVSPLQPDDILAGAAFRALAGKPGLQAAFAA